MPLSGESHRLFVDGRPPDIKEHYLITVRREESGEFVAMALDLAVMPLRERVLYTWSVGIDPDLDEFQQFYGLVQKAIADLDKTLARWQSKIASVDANAGAIPRWSVGWMLLKELTEGSRREPYMGMRAPIGMREPPDYDHVLMELIGVDNLYLRCSPVVFRGRARIIS